MVSYWDLLGFTNENMEEESVPWRDYFPDRNKMLPNFGSIFYFILQQHICLDFLSGWHAGYQD